MTAAVSGYPVNVTLPQERAVNRWWGLLWLGMLVRAILVIPHCIVLAVLGILISIGAIIVWIPILIFGKVPELWCKIVTEVIIRSTRINAYVYLFPGAYPALGWGEQGPVDVKVDVGDREINRLWGIPFFGWMVRLIVVIPQLIVLCVLDIIAGLVALVVWIPVLIWGRYPDLGMKLMGWSLRYNARVTAYVSLLPVPYPPITELE
jgi:hypothetical protein